MLNVRILIFHGYLLHGTGSNVYNANVAEALARAGHEVHLLCQDRNASELDWVDAVGSWDGGRLSVQVRREPVHTVVYRPDIGGLLPVYVADRYEGIEARPYPELSDAELEHYTEANVQAVGEVADRAHAQLALANHLVLGPLICARALIPRGIPYAVKIHGSALEYTVKPHPRFLPHAREGLAGARAILVGSRHTAESLWAALDDQELRSRTRLGPPGVDVDAFGPRDGREAAEGLERLRRRLAAAAEARAAAGDESSSFAQDPAAALDALGRLDLDRDRPVIFVGKLIRSKGVELLIAAWPLVLEQIPAAKLVIVGFGGFRAGLEELVERLASGNLEAAAELRGEDGGALPWLASFLAGLPADAAARYREAARRLPGALVWTGRLEHRELHDLLPAMEAMVVPSTFPEAFGMVAAEAAACGALPVVAAHSGLAEVARTLRDAIPPEAGPLLTFDVGDSAVDEIATAVRGWLLSPEPLRRRTRAALVEKVRERYSWVGVGTSIVAAAQGAVDELPEP